jgi:hypothetical protein
MGLHGLLQGYLDLTRTTLCHIPEGSNLLRKIVYKYGRWIELACDCVQWRTWFQTVSELQFTGWLVIHVVTLTLLPLHMTNYKHRYWAFHCYHVCM